MANEDGDGAWLWAFITFVIGLLSGIMLTLLVGWLLLRWAVPLGGT